MVLEGADEHHRPLVGRDRPRQAVPGVEVVRDRQVEHADEPVDRAGCAGAGEHDDVVLAAVHRTVDDPAGVLAQRRRLEPGGRGLGVGVRVQRQHLVPDEVLDERERAARGGRVGVDAAPRAERSVQERVLADHRAPDRLDEVAPGAHHAPTAAGHRRRQPPPTARAAVRGTSPSPPAEHVSTLGPHRPTRATGNPLDVHPPPLPSRPQAASGRSPWA